MSGVAKLACIDLEGVLVPELWPTLAVRTGIHELFATTRELPDYDALMRQRIDLLRQHGMTLSDVQRITRTIRPFSGAAGFLQALRDRGYEVQIISDCFHELADSMLRALGRPTIFCHSLTTDSEGFISGCDYYRRRDKEEHVNQAQVDGLHVLAVGDALNDIAMLRRADQGFLVNPSITTLAAAPDLQAVENLEEVIKRIA
ncbi:bifunctional phosphoserine phosphatase/homoserine phosphotransferase ThrH [uncultured Pseudomonas sp.]|uniref:bifunctional phosphoserine phosphatase/homoserine phosphotransferase ThrH n=1 Tax=uncultured Pseudomonas sp. TaxID=114707 RepID=UPI0025F3DED5|nr:bifunctional phosphoserine phosphatase/homoserine phosphotransferase ThrH [uncultured Pseudomonas sp.]